MRSSLKAIPKLVTVALMMEVVDFVIPKLGKPLKKVKAEAVASL